MLVGKCEWGGVKSVGAYHERERLCLQGIEVWEVARVHYDPPPVEEEKRIPKGLP